MKKVISALLIGLLLFPIGMDAKQYKIRKGQDIPSIPVKVPARCHIGVYVDEETGDYAVTPNYDIVDLQITITQNGIVMDDTTVSLSAGQSYTDTFDGYAEGDYTLMLRNGDDVISLYTITVE